MMLVGSVSDEPSFWRGPRLPLIIRRENFSVMYVREHFYVTLRRSLLLNRSRSIQEEICKLQTALEQKLSLPIVTSVEQYSLSLVGRMKFLCASNRFFFFFIRQFLNFILFSSSRSFTGSPNESHTDAYLEDNSVAGKSRKLSFSTTACQGGVHRGAVQEVLHREARRCREAFP
jgi:hypothetical protein